MCKSQIISVVGMTSIYSIHTSYFSNTISNAQIKPSTQSSVWGGIICHHSIYIECNKENY